jgi:putative ATPase
MKDVEENPTLEVPKHLQNPVYEGEKKLGNPSTSLGVKGKGYKYAHDYEGGYVKQEHLAEPKKYYEPKDIGFEKKIRQRMEELKKRFQADAK